MREAWCVEVLVPGKAPIEVGKWGARGSKAEGAVEPVDGADAIGVVPVLGSLQPECADQNRHLLRVRCPPPPLSLSHSSIRNPTAPHSVAAPVLS